MRPRAPLERAQRSPRRRQTQHRRPQAGSASTSRARPAQGRRPGQLHRHPISTERARHRGPPQRIRKLRVRANPPPPPSRRLGHPPGAALAPAHRPTRHRPTPHRTPTPASTGTGPTRISHSRPGARHDHGRSPAEAPSPERRSASKTAHRLRGLSGGAAHPPLLPSMLRRSHSPRTRSPRPRTISHRPRRRQDKTSPPGSRGSLQGLCPVCGRGSPRPSGRSAGAHDRPSELPDTS
jgi:hypothetical protein